MQNETVSIMKNYAKWLILRLSILLVCLLTIFPFYWMIVTALQSTRDLFVWPPKIIPNIGEIGVFGELFASYPMGRWLKNSLIIGITTSFVSVFLSILCAYGLSRFRFRGDVLFSLLLVFTQMMPTVLIIIPLFILLKQVSLLNTLFGLVLANTAFTAPITIWILKGYFDTIPIEIEEAGLTDGCSRLGVLYRIILPLAKPAIGTSLVIVFFNAWNEFAFAVTFISDQELWVATVGLTGMIGEYVTPIELMMSGAAVFTIPALVFFLALQKYLVGGLAAGAVKT